MRMVKKFLLLTLSSIILAACDPGIPDPRAAYPPPPPELVTPARTMEPITK
jgi:hypothetical protein